MLHAESNEAASLFKFKHLDSVDQRWKAVAEYNAAISQFLPVGAKEIVMADWHYDYSDPRSLHDSWIQTINFEYAIREKRIVGLNVKLCLLGAFHDRLITLTYLGVHEYLLRADVTQGNDPDDWLYDEIHLVQNRVEHVIEFQRGIYRFVCDDVRCDSQLLNQS